MERTASKDKKLKNTKVSKELIIPEDDNQNIYQRMLT